MHGGDQSPVINSPYNKYRKQISYGSPSTGTIDSPCYLTVSYSLGGSRKTPGTRSGKKDSLARKAVFNRAMSHSEADSPVRPETLQFQEEKDNAPGPFSPGASEVRGVSRKVPHYDDSKPTDSRDSNTPVDDDILPPPSMPPPPIEDSRW